MVNLLLGENLGTTVIEIDPIAQLIPVTQHPHVLRQQRQQLGQLAGADPVDIGVMITAQAKGGDTELDVLEGGLQAVR